MDRLLRFEPPVSMIAMERGEGGVGKDGRGRQCKGDVLELDYHSVILRRWEEPA